MNLTIKTGSTWAPTGGSDLVFASDGRNVPDGVSFVVLADTNLLTRRSLRMRSIMPAAAVRTGDMAKMGRQLLTLYIPFTAADGRTYVQPQKVESAFHPEYGAASKLQVVTDLASLLVDSELLTFWQSSVLPN